MVPTIDTLILRMIERIQAAMAWRNNIIQNSLEFPACCSWLNRLSSSPREAFDDDVLRGA